MSLTTTNLWDVVKTQYHYKLKAQAGHFLTLVAMQLLAFLFSLNGVGGVSGGGGQGITYSIKYYTGDVIIVFTFIWAISVGYSLARDGFKIDFTFVTNRFSSHLSNLAFIFTAAVLAGVTATLCGLLLRVVILLARGTVDAGSVWIAPWLLLGGIFAVTLYVMLLSMIGYLAGMLRQKHPALVALLVGLFLGTLFVEARSTGQSRLFVTVFEFFSQEGSYALLALKVVLVSALVFGCVALFSNRMEVKKWQT